MTYQGPFGMIDPAVHAKIVAAANEIASLLEAGWHGEHVSRDQLKRAVYRYRDLTSEHTGGASLLEREGRASEARGSRS